MINILADQHLYKLNQFDSASLNFKLYDPAQPLPDLDGFNAWLLRTVTKVNEQTAPNIPASLKFIGTGSAGTDHLDENYLRMQGIRVSNAKGCNANTVAEYVITALLLLRESKELDFTKRRIGIIGVGAVGSAVEKLLRRFGCELVLYDPPRGERENSFKSATLDEVLSCDIITLHVPYAEDGNYPTRYLLDESEFINYDFDVVINTARGGVINEASLLDAYRRKSVQYIIIDVWENEPEFNPELLRACFIATPHVAGHSEQSKYLATKMVIDDLYTFLNISYSSTYQNNEKRIDLKPSDYSIKDLLGACHPMIELDAALRGIDSATNRAVHFAKLRTDRPYRFEYPAIRLHGIDLSKYPDLLKLGVQN